MPRTQDTTASQATPSSTQGTTQRTLRSRVRPQEASDEDEPMEAAAPTVAPTKVSAVELEWMEEGWCDLPPIPVLGGSPAAEGDAAEENATLVVRLILMCHHSKYLMTNNKLKNAFQEHCNRPAADFDSAFRRARQLLRDDLGYILAEVRPETPAFPMDGSGSVEPPTQAEPEEDGGTQTQQSRRRKGAAVHYVLISTSPGNRAFHHCGPKVLLSEHREEFVDADPGETARHVMLTLTLLYVFMEGGDVLGELIWNFLKPFGFDVDLVHETLGRVKDTVQRDFVKQEYLVATARLTGSGGIEQMYYKWGARADLTFSRLALVHLCGRIFGVPADTTTFGERYNKAALTEQQRLARLRR